MSDLKDVLRACADAFEAFPEAVQSQGHLFFHGGGEGASGVDAGLACDGDDFAGL